MDKLKRRTADELKIGDKTKVLELDVSKEIKRKHKCCDACPYCDKCGH